MHEAWRTMSTLSTMHVLSLNKYNVQSNLNLPRAAPVPLTIAGNQENAAHSHQGRSADPPSLEAMGLDQINCLTEDGNPRSFAKIGHFGPSLPTL